MTGSAAWFRRSFGARIFLGLFVVVFGTTASITFFHFREARIRSETALRHRGAALARLMANQSRLGVFSGNPDLLRPAAEALLLQPDIVAVSVFSKGAGDLPLVRRAAVDGGAAACRRAMAGASATGGLRGTVSGRPWFEIVVPVSVGRLGLDGHQGEGPVDIGRVCLAMSTATLVEETRMLLITSFATGLVFILIGLGGVYVVVRGVTRPLRRLTRAIRVFGEGRSVQAVPVETEDEIGRLARALNQAGAALMRRQAEKERLEEQLRHAQKMEALGRLTGGIAHDFNNILTTIRCYERLLRMPGTDAAAVTNHARAIGDAVDRGAQSVKALLAFSRKQSTRLEPLELCAMLAGMKGLLQRVLPGGIAVCCETAVDVAWVEADVGQLEQVFVNLATNARDAMPGGGRLELRVDTPPAGAEGNGNGAGRPAEAFVRVTVRDDGAGMDDETLAAAFDPFFTTKPVGEGTGLGLSVAYGIIEAHRGHITVESQPGRGTTFRILLPRIPAPHGAYETNQPAAAGRCDEVTPP